MKFECICLAILMLFAMFTNARAQSCSAIISGSFSICNGEPATLTTIPINQIIYTDIVWSTGETTPTIYPTSPGTYSVTVTCNNGLTDTESITLVNSDEPAPTPIITPFCSNGFVYLSGNNGFAFYLWSTDERSQNIQIPVAGNYCLTVVDNSTGCAGEACIDVSIPVIQDVVIEGDTLLCNGESSTLTVQGNYDSFLWSTGETDNSITVSQAGVYALTVTDAGGCTGTGNITIQQGGNAFVTIDGPGLLCGGALGVLSAVPVNWQSYSWSTGENTPTISVSTSGTYTLTVSDAGGCTSTAFLSVSAQPFPQLQLTVANPDLCSGECILVQADFVGTPPFLLTYTAFNLFFSETFSGNTGSFQVCAPPGTPPGTVLVEAVSLTDAWCTCIGP